MTKVDVLLGLQWGDEGKGKLVDVLTPNYDVIARFQGGPNAGHTLEFDGIKHVLHTIPSGIFREGKINIIGNGVVIDPVIFKKEIDSADDKAKALDEKVYEFTEKFANPYLAAERGFIDDIIEPKDTRKKLIYYFSLLENKVDSNPKKKHGNIPL